MTKSRKSTQKNTNLLEEKIRAEREMASGQFGAIENLCRKILMKSPQDEYACSQLGVAYAQQKRHQEAIEIFEQGLKGNPNSAHLLFNAGVVLGTVKYAEKAYQYAKKAAELLPNNPLAWISYTYAARLVFKYHEVFEAAQHAIELAPMDITARINLGTYFLDTGRPKEALSHYRAALEINPQSEIAHTNLLLSMLYDDASTVKAMATESTRFSKLFDLPKTQLPQHSNTPQAWRKLKLAFIGADISNHAVSYYLEPILARLDRQQYEIHAYHTLHEGDHVTKRLKRYFDSFVTIANFSTEQAFEQIRKDEIDILIDFAGHTTGNGLAIMGKKPAPVQITWLGFPGTTGLKNIDIRLTDEIVDCYAEDGDYSEKLYMLPAPFCVYRPCLQNPLWRYWPDYQVKPTPALENGFITFGSCNNIAKIGLEPLKLWARILAEVPGSRLRIEAWGLDTEEIGHFFTQRCSDAGVDPKRLILVGRGSERAKQYLTYHDIDIALDPFPLTGGTTSSDTLWMGVPMVSMTGNSLRSRLSTTLLTAANLTQWLAQSDDEYIQIAKNLASNIQNLNQTRLSLRRYIEQSPLMDERLFTIYFDNAIREAWVNWCRTQDCNVPPAPEAPLIAEQVFNQEGICSPLDQALPKLKTAVTLKQWDLVYKISTEVLESLPYQVDALLALAEADHANGYNMSVSYLSSAIDSAPQRYDLYIRMAEMLIANNNQQEATQILQLLESRIKQ
ncbi:tetratricopeptide repeat protein [Deefgea tanakiae]|uniref:protein O-GlcNAc transferase n=1 Tax=Deefgea tanakiae TaxID=2865840 RepID=A0ABX8Z9G5_9NEIS|nr:glycosyltransferase family 41 protein [Deefgea tanakiae]QZA79203.1 tetratricopeptide repeat protein [Deefgea tanakiae]